MNNQPKHDIFISYCRKDIEAVKAFKQEIEATTLATCWMDLDGIESGNPKFTKIIINAINSCPIFLFMLTEASQQSENALKELDFAYKKHREEGKKVVIVYLTPCKMNDEFSFDYAKADTIDWQNPLQREKLTRDLKKWTNYKEKVAKDAENIKQTKEQIKTIEREGSQLYAQQKRLHDQIVAMKKAIGESEQTCPVCRGTADIAKPFCPTCGWAYIPFQSAKMDEKRLVIAKRVWEQKSIPQENTEKPAAGELPQCIKELIASMVDVEGGTFQMGGTKEQGEDAFSDEQPVHKVTLSSFAIGQYPVTQEEWTSIMGSNPSHFRGKKLPVENVSWIDCQEFIAKLNEKTGLRFRLPTEAEWEYAARGGKKSKRHKYSGGNILSQVGWYDENSEAATHEVGQKSANELGLYDMSGNVWEWVQDWKGDYSAEEQVNPTGPEDGTERVCRGGGWNREIDRGRVSYRGDDLPDFHYCSLGLRLVLEKQAVETTKAEEKKEIADIQYYIGVLKGHEDNVQSAAFSPDGKKIVSASEDYTVKVWDVQTGECIRTLKGHEEYVQSAAFSPDGKRIVSASDDETVKVWDAQTGECIRTLEGHENFVNSAAFSPDGKRIVSTSWDKTVKVWDAQTEECIRTLEGHKNFVESAAFSPDGKRIVSASRDKTVKVWDAQTGECIRTLKGHEILVHSAAFSPDGKRIVSASDDKTVKVWDAQTGECIRTLKGHKYSVQSAAFSPDGKRIVSASADETLRIWDISDL